MEEDSEIDTLVINGKFGMNLGVLGKYSQIGKLVIKNLRLSQLDLEFIKNVTIEVLQLDHVIVEGVLTFYSFIEKLYLSNIESEISINLFNMISLKELKLFNCKNVQALNVTGLSDLERVYINNSILNGIKGVESLENLTEINLDGSTINSNFEFPQKDNLKISSSKEYRLVSALKFE